MNSYNQVYNNRLSSIFAFAFSPFASVTALLNSVRFCEHLGCELSPWGRQVGKWRGNVTKATGARLAHRPKMMRPSHQAPTQLGWSGVRFVAASEKLDTLIDSKRSNCVTVNEEL